MAVGGALAAASPAAGGDELQALEAQRAAPAAAAAAELPTDLSERNGVCRP